MAKNTQHLRLTPGIDKNGNSAPRYKGKSPSVEPIPVTLKPARTRSSIIPKRKAPRPLAPALQNLLTKNGFDPKTVRLRGERPNPDDEFDELTLYIEGYRDDEVDDDGELILDETFYSVILSVGEKTIFEEELPAGEGQVWPDEDLDGPQYAANDALAKLGIELHNDQDNDMGDDGQGTFTFVYNVHRTEVPAA